MSGPYELRCSCGSIKRAIYREKESNAWWNFGEGVVAENTSAKKPHQMTCEEAVDTYYPRCKSCGHAFEASDFVEI